MSKEVKDVAQVVSEEKYFLTGEDFNGMARRCAKFMAAAESTLELMEYWEEKFYELIVNKRFIPGGRILANAGTYFDDLNVLQKTFLRDYIACYPAHEKRCGQMLNCYVLEIKDSKHGEQGIYETLEDAADITAMEGGVGENFSALRPKGSPIKGNPKYKSSGPISFLKLFDASSKQLRQGGGRRGANMAVMNVDHPDIMEFITCKSKEGEIDNYNISVGITDDFMYAVLNNKVWDLKFEGKIYHSFPAAIILRSIAEHSHKDSSEGGGAGDPGFIFLDTIGKTWAFPQNKPICSNPCVSADTWVMTSVGPRMVRDLIGKHFSARVHGRHYVTISGGFWKTGEKDIYLLETKEGYKLKVTEDHEIYTSNGNKVKACDLEENQEIMLDHVNKNISWPGDGSFEEGYLVGHLIGDGTFMGGPDNKIPTLGAWFPEGQEDVDDGVRRVMDYIENILENMQARSDWQGWKKVKGRNEYRINHQGLVALVDKYSINPVEKKITEKIEMASSDFQKGFLSGFFDTDGTVASIKDGAKNNEVRLWQSNLGRLEAVQRMLHRFGIISKIYNDRKNTGDQEFGGKIYEADHELSISKTNVVRFSEIIGFIDSGHQKKLEEGISEWIKGPYKEKYTARFKSLTKIGKEDVYDVTVSKIHKFNANGLIISNCGEQLLNSDEACDLGAMNLYAYFVSDGVFDYVKYEEDIVTAIRFLDNVLTMNNYPLKYRNDRSKKITMQNRRIGLGIMGLADILMAMGIPYDDFNEQFDGPGDNFVDEVMGLLASQSNFASFQLGKEKGPFLAHLSALEKYRGRRNCCVTTIAPTGTTSMIAGVNGGCEPFFGLVTKKNTTDGSGNVYYMVPDSFKNLCKEYKVELTNERLEEIYNNKGSVQGLHWVPDVIKDVAKTTMDLSADAHIKMQCRLQKYIENSISKTINLPNSATIDDVYNSIIKLWQGGAKGGTIYRDGSRKFQILNVGGPKSKEATAIISENECLEERPHVLPGKTYQIVTKTMHKPENAYITINEHEGRPVEVFMNYSSELNQENFLDFLTHNNVPRETADIICSKFSHLSKENTGIITRLISLCLRYNVPIPAIIKQLNKINGVDIYSLPKRIAKILGSYVPDGTGTNMVCQNFVNNIQCNGELVFQEGCFSCRKCGDSKCG